MKPVVVSQRVEHLGERAERRDALDDRLVRWLADADFLVFPIPNVLHLSDELPEWLKHVEPCGFVLSGGGDIGLDPHRDATETALLDFAQVRQLPVLGICRGMQLMGAHSGTGLKQVEGHVRSRHRLQGAVAGDANSFHSLALTQCPNGYEVIARSEDSEIEAIKHLTLPWEGWMWHPERETAFSARDVLRLRALFL